MFCVFHHPSPHSCRLNAASSSLPFSLLAGLCCPNRGCFVSPLPLPRHTWRPAACSSRLSQALQPPCFPPLCAGRELLVSCTTSLAFPPYLPASRESPLQVLSSGLCLEPLFQALRCVTVGDHPLFSPFSCQAFLLWWFFLLFRCLECSGLVCFFTWKQYFCEEGLFFSLWFLQGWGSVSSVLLSWPLSISSLPRVALGGHHSQHPELYSHVCLRRKPHVVHPL